MKKTIFLIGLFMAMAMAGSYAQRYALIDMEYILEKIPAYEQGNKKIEALSKQWQAEIDARAKEVETMYKKYQSDLKHLSATEKTKRENQIVAKENEIQALQNKYFGQEGELLKQRKAFMQPIQDRIYEVVKDFATSSGYQMVIDRASANSVIFATPDIDISDLILARLGY